MASLLQINLFKTLSSEGCKNLIRVSTVVAQQKCNITSRTMRVGEKIAKPKPYDYKNKGYSYFQSLFDKTTHRFDENSKVIVVDGPIASGKTKFAKDLAYELEMQYFPACDMDMLYINPYGYDMRQLDPELPVNERSFDIKNFCENPNHRNVAAFQIRMYMLRYSQYIDALAHVLSTGQGVVLNRSCYSDFVFLETLFKHNYISKGARSVYYDLKQNTITDLLQPHLAIYLDVPVNKVQENIKKKNLSHEVKSKVFTNQFLQDMESIYKQQYLKDISVHAELLVYDWSNGGESEIVAEDIERIDFDRFDKHDPKLKNWRYEHERDWCEVRMKYCNDKPELMSFFNVPRYDVPELLRSPEDSKIFHEVWNNAPGMKYRVGYNADMGDKNILTKNKLEIRNCD